jgi:S-adenosylmethionine:diacylglycerol 3-amino-3-carboxypropyl transferase
MTTGEATVWSRGRLDARSGPVQLLFGRMYEDAAIEVDSFPPGGRVFCIASAGCTAMALAPDHEVVAVDINPVQLAYAERRFHGSPGSRGKVERGMDLARRLAATAGWTNARLSGFLALDDPAEQLTCWRRHLDTWRFRTALDALLSPSLLRLVYAPRLLGVLPARLGTVMRGRMERCFARHPNRQNPYARSLLLGDLAFGPAPPEAKAIRPVCADAAAYLEGVSPASFDGFSLSNVLDGADDGYRAKLLTAVKRAAAPGALAIIRSFAEPRNESPANRAAADRSMLWGSVLVTPASSL